MAYIDETTAGGKNVLAFLDMISYSEGTDRYGDDSGYNVLVGGTIFDSYADHPRKLVKLNATLSSTAAGRYQILKRNYDFYKKLLTLEDFSPVNQDKIAIQMIRECHALGMIREGRFREAVIACCKIWASFPGAGYGQRENKMDRLEKAYIKAGGQIGQEV